MVNDYAALKEMIRNNYSGRLADVPEVKEEIYRGGGRAAPSDEGEYNRSVYAGYLEGCKGI
jgi:hypothetical protein